MLGYIKKYNYEKLYGFILGDDGQEYFFAMDDFINNPKKIKSQKVRFDVEKTSDSHPRAVNIHTFGKDRIILTTVLDIESAAPYPQDIGIALKTDLERQIEKYRHIEGTTIIGSVSIGRQL
jgi:cold shock CspA family protein